MLSIKKIALSVIMLSVLIGSTLAPIAASAQVIGPVGYGFWAGRGAHMVTPGTFNPYVPAAAFAAPAAVNGAVDGTLGNLVLMNHTFSGYF